MVKTRYLEPFLCFSPTTGNDVSMFVQDGRNTFYPAESLCIQFHLRHGGGGKLCKELHPACVGSGDVTHAILSNSTEKPVYSTPGLLSIGKASAASKCATTEW